jgi:transcriptional regulator with GAF, ATPase, and Fis domain
VKLLRVLQEHRVSRLGGTRPIAVDVRVLAATNRDLEALVREGAFREDSVLPPERRDGDAAAAARAARRHPDAGGAPARSARAESPSGRKRVSKEALDRLVQYDYPGNVRELENILHRAVVLARGALLTTADLPPSVTEPRERPTGGAHVRRAGRRVRAAADRRCARAERRRADARGAPARHVGTPPALQAAEVRPRDRARAIARRWHPG